MSRAIVILLAAALCVSAQDRWQEKENALGAQLASQVRRQTTALDLADAQAYVANLGRSLASYMPGAPEQWTFLVVNEKEGGSTCAPLALPGGYVFVPVQLILSATNEAELAGMLAHAMAHVAQRQDLHQRVPQAQLASIPLIFMGGALGDDNEMVPASFLPAQHQHELDADEAAVHAMAAAGYDPHALLDYIKRMQPDESRPYSPLPPKAERLQNLTAAIESTTMPQPRVQSDTFSTIQQEIRAKQARIAMIEAPRLVPSLLHQAK